MSTFVIILIYTTGNPKQKNFIESMKISKLFLNDDVENQVYKCIQDKMKLNNTAVLFNLSQLYHLSSLTKPTLCFVERCFPTIADSQNFLEFDFVAVRKILSSSYLNIDSELQVFNATYAWLGHNKERSKYEKVLLLKVRLPLLSDSALNHILRENSCFTMSDECAGIVKNVLEDKNGFYLNKSANIIRFCNQEDFNIVICGGRDINKGGSVSDVHSMNSKYNVTSLPQMIKGRKFCKAVCIKNDVYVFGGVNDNDDSIMSVEKYSPSANTWTKIADMYDKRQCFCACSFMNNVYVIGGSFKRPCIEFKTKDNKWRKVASMNEARTRSACAVYDGRIVVSGGFGRGAILNSVEAYDHVSDSWSSMPNMSERRTGHKSVAIKSKLFVVGGLNTPTCEVFDSTCNKFVLLKRLSLHYRNYLYYPVEVVSIGNDLVVFCNEDNNVLFYNVVSEVWSENTLELEKEISSFSCTKSNLNLVSI